MSRSNILHFLSICGKLKHLVRTGWTRYGIEKPECVADHMYRMALMATILPASEMDGISVDRLIKMAIIHDLAESIVGDITPHCNVTREEKLRREKNAMTELCSLLPNENAQEILELWNEFNAEQSPEARMCKDLDKFDMILQAFEYEQETKNPGMLQEFFASTLGSFSTPVVNGLVDELCAQRKKFQDEEGKPGLD